MNTNKINFMEHFVPGLWFFSGLLEATTGIKVKAPSGFGDVTLNTSASASMSAALLVGGGVSGAYTQDQAMNPSVSMCGKIILAGVEAVIGVGISLSPGFILGEKAFLKDKAKKFHDWDKKDGEMVVKNIKTKKFR